MIIRQSSFSRALAFARARRRLVGALSLLLLLALWLAAEDIARWLYFVAWLPFFVVWRCAQILRHSRPLIVTGQGLWDSPAEVLRELHVLRTLFRPAHELVPADAWLPMCVRYAVADVQLLSVFQFPHDRMSPLCLTLFRRPMTLFIAGENTEEKPTWHDQALTRADVSFGHRRDISSTHYLRLPYWLPYIVDQDGGAQCRIAPHLLASAADPHAEQSWQHRQRFTVQIFHSFSSNSKSLPAMS